MVLNPSGWRIGHFDAGFGISGDMALGALLDAGAGIEAVNAALAAVGVPGLRAEPGRALRCGLDCAHVRIRWDGDDSDAASPPPTGQGPHHAAPEPGTGAAGGRAAAERAPQGGAAAPDHHAHDHDLGGGHGHDHGGGHGHDHPNPHGGPGAQGGEHRHGPGHVHRGFREIRAQLQAAPLPAGVRDRALAIFARLAEAEGRIHGRSPDDVHFHEVGGQDALGDVVGVAAALEDLAVGMLTVSALPAGGGTIQAAHGRLPVPAPAVALLLRDFDWIPGPVAAELVTPTGAAIVAALAEPAGGWPALRLRGSGWGAGSRDFPGHPNACRFVWGEAPAGGTGRGAPVPAGPTVDTLVELETNLDDQTPEQVGYLYERLFAAGALDVVTSPLWMKKQRPGVRLWALVRPADLDAAARCLFAESSALGLRVRDVRRWSLPRTVVRVRTAYGEVQVKVAHLDGAVANAAPEYEDCRAAAVASGVPLKTVMAAALAAWGAAAAPPA